MKEIAFPIEYKNQKGSSDISLIKNIAQR